jgi:hypothetical protein
MLGILFFSLLPQKSNKTIDLSSKKMANKVTIINHGGQLGNQLWNYASIYAYALEKGYDCCNPAFFHYQKFFPKTKTTLLPKIFFGPLFNFFPKKRYSISWLYNCYIKLKFGSKKIAKAVKSSDEDGGLALFFLPPTENNNQQQNKELSIAENTTNNILFSGYAFRNPTGLLKYHSQISQYFSPQPKISATVNKLIAEARKKYSKIIGVHIRQGDYRNFMDGKYYFSPEKISLILNDFIKKTGLNNSCFIISSDEKINPKTFSGLNIILSSGKTMEDLFTLAKTDIIIGTNSTFGAFAAYYGNIPMAIFSEKQLDWNFYLNKKTFFFDQDLLANFNNHRTTT